MRVALTGTPGTGKSTVAQLVAEEAELEVVPISKHAEEFSVDYDEDRGVEELDVEAMEQEFADLEDVVFDGHVSHQLSVDHVVVLRCHPEELGRRLRERGYSEDKIGENTSSEALDLVTAEAIHRHDEVYEIDTTDRSPEYVAEKVVDALESGAVNADVDGITVDWSDYLESMGVEG